jgi:predicted transposase YdaD
MLSEALGYHSQWKEKAAAHKKNKDLKTDEFMSGIKRSEKYSTLSEDTAFLLEKLTDTRIFRNEKKRGQEWRRGNMCKAFEDYKEEGRQEGKMEAVAEMCREFGLSEEDIISKIMEKCDVSRDTAEEYIKK